MDTLVLAINLKKNKSYQKRYGMVDTVTLSQEAYS